jgi:tetratricopeptide (TPR) repeat protein
MLNQLITFTTAVFFFLFPLFFLTTTSESYEYNKMFLLFFTTLFLFLLHSLKVITEKKISFKTNSFFSLFFFLTGIFSVSTLFQSPNLVNTLTTPLSTGTILAGFFLYLLLINTFWDDARQTKQPKIPIFQRHELNASDDRSFLGTGTWWQDNGDRQKAGVSEKLGIEDANMRQNLPICINKKILMNILILDAVILSIYSLLLYTGILPPNFFTPAGSILATTTFLAIVTMYLLVKVVIHFLRLFAQQDKISDRLAYGTHVARSGIEEEFMTQEKERETTLLRNVDTLRTRKFLSASEEPILPYLLALLFIGATAIFLTTRLFTTQKPLILPFGFGWVIFLEVLKNIKTLFLGVGPSNFLTAFTLTKPVFFNQSQVWNVIFTSSSSFFLNIATETGILSGIIYIGIVFKAIRLLTRNTDQTLQIFAQQDKISEDRIRNRVAKCEIEEEFMTQEKERETTLLQNVDTLRTRKFLSANEDLLSDRNHQTRSQGLVFEDLPYKVALLFALLLQLFLPSNMPLFTITVILLAFASPSFEVFKVDLSQFGKSLYLLLISSTTVVVVVTYFAGRIYLAEMTFKNSLDALVNNQGSQAYNFQKEALSLNPYLDRYHTAYSQVNLALANALAGKTPLDDSDKQNIPRLVQQSIDHARLAVNLYRTNVVTWDNLAKIYASLGNYAKDADTWAVKSYEQRIALDPVNPLARLSLGGYYLSLKKYPEAENLFRQSVGLKPDFANAYFNLGLSLREQKKYQESYQAFQNALTFVAPNSSDSAKIQEEAKLIPSKYATTSSHITPPITPSDTNQQLQELETSQPLEKPSKNQPTIILEEPPISP